MLDVVKNVFMIYSLFFTKILQKKFSETAIFK
jgi:hypothetical protein